MKNNYARYMVSVKSTDTRREDAIFTDDSEKIAAVATIMTLKGVVEIKISDTDADNLIYLARNGHVIVDKL